MNHFPFLYNLHFGNGNYVEFRFPIQQKGEGTLLMSFTKRDRQQASFRHSQACPNLWRQPWYPGIFSDDNSSQGSCTNAAADISIKKRSM